MTFCLPFRTAIDVAAASEAAAEVLSRHKIVALPTETFYGLAVRPDDAEGVAAVFSVKRRPSERSLPVIASDMGQVEQLVNVPDLWRRRLGSTWPAPLTVILPARRPLACAAGTLAVRVPAHDLLRTLLGGLGPLTATSANRSGAAPITLVEEVCETLGESVGLVLDGGTTAGGQPSTIVDCCTDPPIVLRQGAFCIPPDWGVKVA